MEDMAREFGGMLKETLDKMRERIELSSTNLDVDVVPDGAAVGRTACAKGFWVCVCRARRRGGGDVRVSRRGRRGRRAGVLGVRGPRDLASRVRSPRGAVLHVGRGVPSPSGARGGARA